LNSASAAHIHIGSRILSVIRAIKCCTVSSSESEVPVVVPEIAEYSQQVLLLK